MAFCFVSAPAKRAEHQEYLGNFDGLIMPSLIAKITSHAGQNRRALIPVDPSRYSEISPQLQIFCGPQR